MGNIVAIVGRPNVGKSTLFNRLIEQKKAIMDNVSGVTRDRHYGRAQWTDYFFSVIDTGGFVQGSDDIFEEAIREQVQIAIDEADVLLFMVDSRTGLTPLDEEFAKYLRANTKKPILLVANKADTLLQIQQSAEFYALGMGDPFPISSENGQGTGELLDEIVKNFKLHGDENTDIDIPKISILGRPNVGKSSFLNTIIGKSRSIVTDIAGTTRDSIHTEYNFYGKNFWLIDTAGLRRKAKIKDDIEFYSTLRSVRAMEESDVCLVLLDASRGLEAQDMTILGMIHRAKKGMVVMINKWDLVEKSTNTARDWENEIRQKLAPIDYMPIIFGSVLTKQRIFQVLEKLVEVYENRKKKIATSAINEALLKEIEKYPPPSYRSHPVKIKYIIQLPTPSPTFIFFANHPDQIKENYQRFLENKIRHHFGFEGVPIQVFFRKK